jgi:rubrerythrin
MEQENRKKLIALVGEQIKIEKDHVKHLTELEKKMRYAAAKLLVLEMRLDSEKHSDILTAIIKTLEGIPSNETFWQYELESYIDPEIVKRELNVHAKMENDVLAHIEKEFAHTTDEGLKLLLQNIEADKKKHQKMLGAILHNLYKISP